MDVRDAVILGMYVISESHVRPTKLLETSRATEGWSSKGPITRLKSWRNLGFGVAEQAADTAPIESGQIKGHRSAKQCKGRHDELRQLSVAMSVHLICLFTHHSLA